jgi:hypothetical protein
MVIPKYDWEYNVLGIYDYRKPGPLDLYFSFIRTQALILEGDIVEAGVYRGRTILATALLLKEIGSHKKIYGFDSFSGFPPVLHQNDKRHAFDDLYHSGLITKDHYEAVQRNFKLKETLMASEANVSNISTSGNFDNTSRQLVERKMELLGLDNIVLVEGSFSETMIESQDPDKIMAVMVDCDLYQSYIDTFKFTWSHLVRGGMYYLDEYFSLKFPGGRIACEEFFENKPHQMIKAPMVSSDQFERWAALKC